MAQEGILIVFSGFSGAGKGTIMKELLKRYPDICPFRICYYQSPKARRDGRN